MHISYLAIPITSNYPYNQVSWELKEEENPPNEKFILNCNLIMSIKTSWVMIFFFLTTSEEGEFQFKFYHMMNKIISLNYKTLWHIIYLLFFTNMVMDLLVARASTQAQFLRPCRIGLTSHTSLKWTLLEHSRGPPGSSPWFTTLVLFLDVKGMIFVWFWSILQLLVPWRLSTEQEVIL